MAFLPDEVVQPPMVTRIMTDKMFESGGCLKTGRLATHPRCDPLCVAVLEAAFRSIGNENASPVVMHLVGLALETVYAHRRVGQLRVHPRFWAPVLEVVRRAVQERMVSACACELTPLSPGVACFALRGAAAFRLPASDGRVVRVPMIGGGDEDGGFNAHTSACIPPVFPLAALLVIATLFTKREPINARARPHGVVIAYPAGDFEHRHAVCQPAQRLVTVADNACWYWFAIFASKIARGEYYAERLRGWGEAPGLEAQNAADLLALGERAQVRLEDAQMEWFLLGARAVIEMPGAVQKIAAEIDQSAIAARQNAHLLMRLQQFSQRVKTIERVQAPALEVLSSSMGDTWGGREVAEKQRGACAMIFAAAHALHGRGRLAKGLPAECDTEDLPFEGADFRKVRPFVTCTTTEAMLRAANDDRRVLTALLVIWTARFNPVVSFFATLGDEAELAADGALDTLVDTRFCDAEETRKYADTSLVGNKGRGNATAQIGVPTVWQIMGYKFYDE